MLNSNPSGTAQAMPRELSEVEKFKAGFEDMIDIASANNARLRDALDRGFGPTPPSDPNKTGGPTLAQSGDFPALSQMANRLRALLDQQTDLVSRVERIV